MCPYITFTHLLLNLRLCGVLISTNAVGESGGASKMDSSWPWSELCFEVGFQTWPGFGPAPVALGTGGWLWFAVELDAVEVLETAVLLGLREDRPLKEPDFTKKKPPLSWEAVLMGDGSGGYTTVWWFLENRKLEYSKVIA